LGVGFRPPPPKPPNPNPQSPIPNKYILNLNQINIFIYLNNLNNHLNNLLTKIKIFKLSV